MNAVKDLIKRVDNVTREDFSDLLYKSEEARYLAEVLLNEYEGLMEEFDEYRKNVLENYKPISNPYLEYPYD